jgi:hypothetical protein
MNNPFSVIANPFNPVFTIVTWLISYMHAIEVQFLTHICHCWQVNLVKWQICPCPLLPPSFSQLTHSCWPGPLVSSCLGTMAGTGHREPCPYGSRERVSSASPPLWLVRTWHRCDKPCLTNSWSGRARAHRRGLRAQASPLPRHNHGRPRELEVEDELEGIVVILKQMRCWKWCEWQKRNWFCNSMAHTG